MIHLTFVMEDTIVVADRHEDSWFVEISDTATGRSHEFMCKDEKMGAILALAAGGDELPGSEELYKLAESALQECPPECRPIP